MNDQNDDEPREASATYRPYIPGINTPRPRRERRIRAQIKARARRRMERATTRAIKEVERDQLRPQLREDMSDDTVTLSADLEEGTVTETR